MATGIAAITATIPGENRNLIQKGWDQNFFCDVEKPETLAAAKEERRQLQESAAKAKAAAAIEIAVATALAAQRQGADAQAASAAAKAAAAASTSATPDEVSPDVRSVAELERTFHVSQVPSKKALSNNKKARPGAGKRAARRFTAAAASGSDDSGSDSIEGDSNGSEGSDDARVAGGGIGRPSKKARVSTQRTANKKMTPKEKLVARCAAKNLCTEGTVKELKKRLAAIDEALTGPSASSLPLSARFPIIHGYVSSKSSSSSFVITEQVLIEAAQKKIASWIQTEHLSLECSPEQREVCRLLRIRGPADGKPWRMMDAVQLQMDSDSGSVERSDEDERESDDEDANASKEEDEDEDEEEDDEEDEEDEEGLGNGKGNGRGEAKGGTGDLDDDDSSVDSVEKILQPNRRFPERKNKGKLPSKFRA